MNAIPSIGPEPAIAPRTGSGSPQTTPQQRADGAPVVVSDSSAARADPGVMLKIAPPVGARQGDVAIPQHALPGEVARTLAELEAERAGEIKALLGSASDADEAVSARLAQAFAALPADVQEAIRQATTPGMAQLLRLVSLTASGIRDAPARLHTGEQPLAGDAQQAAKALLDAIRSSPPFQLAQLLRAVAQGRAAVGGSGVASSQTAFNAPPATLPQGFVAGIAGTSPGIATAAGATNLQPAPVLPGAAGLTAAPPAGGGGDLVGLAQRGALSATAIAIQASERASPSNLANPGSIPGSTPPNGGAVGGAVPMSGSTGFPPSPVGVMGGPTLSALLIPGQAPPNQQGMFSPGQAPTQIQAQANQQGVPEIAQGQQGSSSSLSPGNSTVVPPVPIAVNQAEAGLRDALRLLMDGRMVWQGQFTAGVPMALERADAWRANRRETGGMEKGTSLRLRLQLPSLGDVEVRALGFGGQVSVRVHAPAGSTGEMVNALPQLQARLRERGLAGAQVVVETL